MYRKGISDETNDATLNKILEKVSEICESVLVMGDFNFPDIDRKISWSCFYDKLQDIFLTQNVEEFTRVRGNNQPDLIITRQPNCTENLEALNVIGNSHYCVLFIDFLYKTEQTKRTDKIKRNFFKGN